MTQIILMKIYWTKNNKIDLNKSIVVRRSRSYREPIISLSHMLIPRARILSAYIMSEALTYIIIYYVS